MVSGRRGGKPREGMGFWAGMGDASDFPSLLSHVRLLLQDSGPSPRLGTPQRLRVWSSVGRQATRRPLQGSSRLHPSQTQTLASASCPEPAGLHPRPLQPSFPTQPALLAQTHCWGRPPPWLSTPHPLHQVNRTHLEGARHLVPLALLLTMPQPAVMARTRPYLQGKRRGM